MSRVIINHERYGDKTVFATIEDAEAAIRDCGPEFESVSLALFGDAIYDDRQECVGCLVTDDDDPATR